MSVVSVSKPKIRMWAQLWQPDLKRSFERRTTLASRNSLLVRLHSWNWECRTTHRASSTVPWGNWWTTHTGESFGKASEEEKQGPGTMWVKQCPAWVALPIPSSGDRKFQGRHSRTRVPFCHRALDRCPDYLCLVMVLVVLGTCTVLKSWKFI